MARYQHLPIWNTAMQLAVALECAVARFPRYHKYALGAELRRSAQALLTAVMRAAGAALFVAPERVLAARSFPHKLALSEMPPCA